MLEIQVLDHLIITDSGYMSFADERLVVISDLRIRIRFIEISII